MTNFTLVICGVQPARVPADHSIRVMFALSRKESTGRIILPDANMVRQFLCHPLLTYLQYHTGAMGQLESRNSSSNHYTELTSPLVFEKQN